VKRDARFASRFTKASDDMDNSLTFEIEADEIETFLQDVNEHLQSMEAGILQLEQGDDPDALNSVFRAAHTLKAVAGTVGHHSMAELTHTMETLFDAMRKARLSLTQDLADELLTAIDVLKALRDEVVTRQPSGIDVTPVLARLRGPMEAGAVLPSGEEEETFLPPAVPPLTSPLQAQNKEGELTSEQAAQVKGYHEQGYTIFEIQAIAEAGTFAPAARLLQAAMALTEAGHIIAQCPLQDDLLNEQQRDRLWLLLATRSDADAVEEILNDVSDLAGFRVQPYAVDLAIQSAAGSPPAIKSSLKSPESPRVSPSQEQDKTVRISVERLDTLMNLVGELVTDRTRLAQIEGMLRTQYGKAGSVAALDETLSRMSQVVDQLQEEVMRARMLPIAHLFDKCPRLVRDAARAAGKQVDLVIEGQSTELDRSIIEAIGDPLIHLLRNAVDHGVESPQARSVAGKPSTGTVRLAAAHVEGQIAITVQDDGRGIDPHRTRQAAVRHGLISEDEAAHLSDDEAITLIFRPGLSTAEQVTGVSGRGVGLDVVRTNINRIGGSVVVENELGRGATFRLTLPLTLAILPTMLVVVGDDVYAVPLTSIVESLYLSDVTVSSIKGYPAIHWRNQVLPLLNLRQFFGRAPRATGDAHPAVVAVTWGKLQVGLVVDKIIGKQEIVVKPLGSLIGNVPGLSGCTILGNGRIALIVDVSSLINAAMQARTQAPAQEKVL
jgi:two-component system chemotaxis sensor kinase CheA